MQNNKVYSLMGFAIRSRQVAFGLDAIEKAKKKPYLVFVCKSLAANSYKKIEALSQKYGFGLVSYREILLEDACHKTNCKVLGIYDKMMAKGILDSLDDNFLLHGGKVN